MDESSFFRDLAEPNREGPVRSIVLLIGLVVGVAMAGDAVRAHHAFAAEFDVNQPIVLKGVVSKA
jgi:hypothetical protein